ncbi:TPA: hypothetical protein SI478_000697 [Escherichia coli]|uniref:hypothetical protein n=1 Tax=Escherichia coli TaxID=562 RepID=UPI0017EBB35B|nr:hypothetical protein [Escherichia coli]MBB8154074.1 hypothetical protein [Escherichia coli]HAN4396881.1 hypothetical protein [Escherichia coli]HBN7114860.1 hypothetical protein [Escherichia coli]HEI2275923.1 hypothetical protein [Escherichia coli]
MITFRHLILTFLLSFMVANANADIKLKSQSLPNLKLSIAIPENLHVMSEEMVATLQLPQEPQANYYDEVKRVHLNITQWHQSLPAEHLDRFKEITLNSLKNSAPQAEEVVVDGHKAWLLSYSLIPGKVNNLRLITSRDGKLLTGEVSMPENAVTQYQTLMKNALLSLKFSNE